MKLVAVAALAFTPSIAFSWGGRGHHSICSAAVHLVQEDGLREFLRHRPHIMGHLCNIPDIYWKSLPREIAGSGNSAHYVDPEIFGLAIRDVGLDFSALEKEFTGKPNQDKPGAVIRSVANEFGSAWWRVEQFFLRVTSRKNTFAKIKLPSRSDEQNDDFPYNREVYDMMVNMGLMGHYVGDLANPLHNTTDYDGFKAGHGGLHAYYEELSVAEAPGDLEARIVASGSKIKSAAWMKGTSVPAKMREFSAVSYAEIPKVLKADPIKKKSELRKEKGMDIKRRAEREPPTIGWTKFNSMIVPQMGRAARLLAHLWDQMYVDVGRPDLSKYRSYRYPFTPDFVTLDYVTKKKGESL